MTSREPSSSENRWRASGSTPPPTAPAKPAVMRVRVEQPKRRRVQMARQPKQAEPPQPSGIVLDAAERELILDLRALNEASEQRRKGRR